MRISLFIFSLLAVRTTTMSNATGLYSLAPCATQQLIVKAATDIGFELHEVPIIAPRPPHVPFDCIVPMQFIPLYRQCMAALYRASMSLPASEHPNSIPTCDEVDLFCACLINCEDLDEVIAKAMRFTRFFNIRGESTTLIKRAVETEFQMHTHNKDRSQSALLCDLFGLGFFNRLFGWLIGEPLQLARVDVVYPPLIPSDLADYIVGGPVRFGSTYNALSFPTSLLLRPVVRRHKELADLLQSTPIELVDMSLRPNLPSQIERIFKKLMAEGRSLPSLDRVAELVGQPASTLRRHLAQHDTSYQSLVDRCRLERAQELLRDTAMTVDDIAAHLGYSASSSFSRAFKDWMGCAPSIYRQSLAGDHTNP
jgi:AraC-like DNA-binding protein